MTCDEAELMLSSAETSAALEEHLQGCAACKAFGAELGEVLALSALPAPTPAIRRALDGLPQVVRAQWSAQQRRRSIGQRVLGYAVAAALGGLVATAALHGRAVPVASAPVAVAEVVAADPADELPTWEVAAMDEDFDVTEPVAAVDELAGFEVPWTAVDEL
jgi:predicted anti-sigma-YlaC factor YlaD